MTEEQIASTAAQQECNLIVSTLVQRCIVLAADLALTQAKLVALTHKKPEDDRPV